MHKSELSPEHLAGYKRIGEQVFEVEAELSESTNAKARALLQAAKSLQVMGDALLREVEPRDKKSLHLATETHEQAEAWYGHIPDLLIGARKEAAFEGSSTFPLPFQLRSGRDMRDMQGTCPIEHLAGMRRAADEMEDLVKDKMAFARTQGETYKDVILLFEEARTRRGAGDAIVGSIMEGQRLPPQSHEDAEVYYRAVLSDYLLIAQALEDPSLKDKRASTSSATGSSTAIGRSTADGRHHCCDMDDDDDDDDDGCC